MITLTIGSEARTLSDDLSDVDEAWINRAVNQPSTPPCVRLEINVGHVNVTLATPNCASGGGGRPPNPDEKRVFDLWNEIRLNADGFKGGQLVAFLKRVRRQL